MPVVCAQGEAGGGKEEEEQMGLDVMVSDLLFIYIYTAQSGITLSCMIHL